jgi:hypothetical protein
MKNKFDRKKYMKEYNKKYQEEHQDELDEYKKEWYQKNKVKIIKRQKKSNQLRKKEITEYKTKYSKNRRKIDINFKIMGCLRHRVYLALKGNLKLSTTMKLMGCSIEQLKQHLESKFNRGMSWKNYGKWHVDHIKPCVSFDLTKPSEQLKCFHYTNLQPLWAKDNQSKRDNIISALTV